MFDLELRFGMIVNVGVFAVLGQIMQIKIKYIKGLVILNVFGSSSSKLLWNVERLNFVYLIKAFAELCNIDIHAKILCRIASTQIFAVFTAWISSGINRGVYTHSIVT